MYNGVLLGHEEDWSNAICSNINGPRDYQARERQVSYAITHMWDLILKNNTNELIHKTEILTDIENKLIPKEKPWGRHKSGGWINIHTLLYIR